MELFSWSAGGFFVFFVMLLGLAGTGLDIRSIELDLRHRGIAHACGALAVGLLGLGVYLFSTHQFPHEALARMAAFGAGYVAGFVIFLLFHRPHVRRDVPPVVIGALAIG